MAKIDHSKVKYNSLYGYYYKDEYGLVNSLSKKQLQAHYNYLQSIGEDIQDGGRARGKRNRVGPTTQNFQKLFKGTVLKNRGGYIADWAKPMSLKEGVEYGWKEVRYQGGDKLKRGKIYWGSDLKSYKKGTYNAGAVLVGKDQWLRHLKITMHQLLISSEHFRIALGHLALQEFKKAFVKKQFQSKGSTHWRDLSDYTKRKRAKRGTLEGGILVEYGDLKDSIKFKQNAAPMMSRVYTDTVPANAQKHKKHAICYAGFHNEGVGTYGKRKGKPGMRYIKRQFMGHSTTFDPMTNKAMNMLVKRYLFDDVFLVRKV